MEPVPVVLVGAGQRGRYVYAAEAAQRRDIVRLVGVVDPVSERRDAVAEAHDIPIEARFARHEEALSLDAAGWIVATPDRHHHAPATAALGSGRHVLLEKPMAPTVDETVDLLRVASQADGVLVVGHVLRYTPFFSAVHEVVASGRLGDVVTVEHRENVVAWHMAHSFVRGNWAHEAESSPMLLAKCCHDFDILNWNLDSPVRRLSSVGSLMHFRPDNAPAGSTERCTDPCPVTDCPFDARRIYLNEARRGWPVHVITNDLSAEGRMRALRDGPYGRCVYRAGSDVVDHQVVTMELEDGASVVLVMHGHSHEEARTMRYDGTRATLRATFGRTQSIEVTDHATAETETITIGEATSGHGGGDAAVLEAFVTAIATGDAPLTSARESVESHLLAFAAEEARTEGSVVDMSAYRERVL